MQITARGTLTECQAKRGSSSPAVLWLKFRLPLDGLKDVEIAKLSRFVNGDPVGVAVDLGPFVAAGTGASGNGRQVKIEDAAPAEPAKRRPERPMPLPEETCASCAQTIGEDPGRRFYTPIAGGPRPMHGACADEAETSRGLHGEAAASVRLDGETQTIPEAGAVEEIPGAVEVVETERIPAAPDAPEAPDGWAFTDDPPAGETSATLNDPEAAAALAAVEGAELPPHLAKIDAASDAAFDQLGPSPAARRRARKAADVEAGAALAGESD